MYVWEGKTSSFFTIKFETMADSKKEGRVKLITGIPEFIAKNGLRVIEARLDKMIPDENPLQDGVDIFFGATAQLLDVVTDENADNKGQIKKVIFGTINGKIVPFLVDLSQPAIDAIKDEDNKAVVVYMRGVAADFVKIYTDDVDQNAQQLSAYMDMIRKSPKTEQIVLHNLLLNRLKKKWEGKEDYLIFIEGVLKELWKLVKGEDEDAAVSSLESQIKSLQA